MPLDGLIANNRNGDVGRRMDDLIKKLYPICRSITGNGVRETLRIIGERVPMEITEVPTGTKVFDWVIPKEWNVKNGYIENSTGLKIVDFEKMNLHVLGYSVPINAIVSLEELKNHIFTDPEQPDSIPYRTSYYNEQWGFCLSHNQLSALNEDHYKVVIESSLEDGHLTYGECIVRGKTDQVVLISCHVCHPSLCNDNLSGISLATCLAEFLRLQKLKYTYRFLFVPATIGSIAWLSQNESFTDKIAHGLVAANLGDGGKFVYKKSRRGAAEIDRVAQNVLKFANVDYTVSDFSPYGYDERQYCSPGFNLPVGCLSRSPHGSYPQYHTSADNLEFVSPENLADSYSIYLSIINVLENNETYINLNPKCEPQLGKRGLYQKIGGASHDKNQQMAMLWVLNLSDGNHTLLDISDKSNLQFELIRSVVPPLIESGLLKLKSSAWKV
jgi:aminopeptidase-like protein